LKKSAHSEINTKVFGKNKNDIVLLLTK
jgi:hypothetical protein